MSVVISICYRCVTAYKNSDIFKMELTKVNTERKRVIWLSVYGNVKFMEKYNFSSIVCMKCFQVAYSALTFEHHSYLVMEFVFF